MLAGSLIIEDVRGLGHFNKVTKAEDTEIGVFVG